jgi:hypothetical protein
MYFTHSGRTLTIILVLLLALAVWVVPSLTFADTVNLKVGNSGGNGYDDAHEYGNGSFSNGSTVVLAASNLDDSTGDYKCGGHRFLDVQIPQDATISSATLRLYVFTTSFDSPNFTVYANGDDDTGATGAAADFSTNADVIQRARTSTGVSHTDTDIGTGWWTFPVDLKDVIQEVVNRETWNPGGSGGTLVLLLIGNIADYSPLGTYSYDQDSQYGAELDIEYTASGGSGITLNHSDGEKAVGRPHQRKVVRDADGYWYVVYMDWDGADYEIFLTKSTNTDGTAWESPVELAGDAGIIYTDATYSLYWPAIDIDRTNGALHIVFTREGTAGSQELYYSKCTDLANWDQAASWSQVDGGTSPRYDTVATNAYNLDTDARYAPSVAVDSNGGAHVLYIGLFTGHNHPHYYYGDPSTGWGSALILSTSYSDEAYPVVEIDSSDTVHAIWTRQSGGFYEEVYHRTNELPYYSPGFDTPEIAIIGTSGSDLINLSMAADESGNVQVICENDTDSEIWGASYDGSVWTEMEGIDTLGWDKPMVGVKLGCNIIDDIIISAADGTDPDAVSYWKWNGWFWNQPETDTGETSDSFVSLEKQAPGSATDMGYLIFDSSTGELTLARITDLLDGPDTCPSPSPPCEEYDTTWGFDDQLSCDDDWTFTDPGATSGVGSRGDSQDWSYSETDTPSSVTGPLGPQAGAGYVYTESSSTTLGDTFTMELTNPINATELSMNCSFWLSRDLDSGGTFPPEVNFEVWDGDVYQTVGQWGDAAVKDWESHSFDLSSYTNSDFKVRFRFVTGGATTYENDLGIDTVRIWGTCPASTPFITLGEHSSGQIEDQFDDAESQTDADLFRFQLDNASGEDITINQIRFHLTGISGISADDLTNLRINDGTSNVSIGGVVSIEGDTGVITFNADFTVTASTTEDYTLIGDVANLGAGDTLTLSLDTNSIVPVSAGVDGTPPEDATHTYGFSMAPLVVYSDDGVTSLKYSLYESGDWTTGADAVSGSSWDLIAKVARTHPELKQQVAVWKDNDLGTRDHVFVTFWDGTNWDDGDGSPYGDAEDLGPTLDSMTRSFDAAYEQSSGELLVVSAITTDDSIDYWTYDESSGWTSYAFEPLTARTGTNLFQWVKLAPKPHSNEIALIVADANGGAQAAIWDGDTNSWTNKTVLTSSLSSVKDAIAVDYIRSGTEVGKAVFAWHETTDRIYGQVWNGTTYETVYEDVPSGTVNWLRLKADPNSSKMLLGFEYAGSGPDIYTLPWTGTDWGTEDSIEDSGWGDGDNYRCFDIAWDLDSGTDCALIVYGDGSGLRYQTSSDGGASWGGEQDVSVPCGAYWVQLDRDPSDDTIHLAIHDDGDDLNTWTWSSATWTFENEISTDLQAVSLRTHEVFALASYPVSNSGTLPPDITAVDYNFGSVAGTITITGTDFGSSQGNITINGVTANVESWSDTEIVITVPAGATDGGYIQVTTGGGSDSTSDLGEGTFDVITEAPQITAIVPNKGSSFGDIDITKIEGSYLSPGVTVTLAKSGESDIPADNPILSTQTLIQAASNYAPAGSFDISGAAVGEWDVVLTNPDGQSATLTAGFTIHAPSQITSASGASVDGLRSNSRHLVRDSAENLYAVFLDDYDEVLITRSTDGGQTWDTPTRLVGTMGVGGLIAESKAPSGVSMDIYRSGDVATDVIHIVFENGNESASENAICYSQCTDLNNYDLAASWSQVDAQTVPHYDTLATTTTSSDGIYWPNVTVDSQGYPHVAWLKYVGGSADVQYQTPRTTIDPTYLASTIKDTASFYPTDENFQRKTFYARDRFWAFFAGMSYSSSTDGSTWEESTPVDGMSGLNGCDFSVWFDGQYIHYAGYGSSNKLWYGRGMPQTDGTITWGVSDPQCLDDASYPSYPRYPSICVDDDGYPWIGFKGDSFSDGYPYVTKSSSNDGTWTTDTTNNFPKQLSSLRDDGTWRVSVVPLGNGDVYALYAYCTGTGYYSANLGNLWDESTSSWVGEESISGSSYAIDNASAHSLVERSNYLHLVYIRYGDIYYQKRTSGGWQGEVTV